MGKCLGESAFTNPYSIAVDPTNSAHFFIGDAWSIRYCTATTVSLIAGSASSGFADGIGAAAKFDSITGLVVTRDGARLYAADCMYGFIRSVDLKTLAVTTIAGDGTFTTRDGIGRDSSLHAPRKIIFDRSLSSASPIPVQPESVMFISSSGAIRRLDLITKQLTTCPWKAGTGTGTGTSLSAAVMAVLRAFSIVMTPSGHLILISSSTRSVPLHLYDPHTGELELLCGCGSESSGHAQFADGPGQTARFDGAFDGVVFDSERCIFITDSNNKRLRHMTLPDHLFTVRH